MVLNHCFMSVALVLFLTGCSTLLTSSDQQRQQVIPAYTDPDEEQGETQDDDSEEVKPKNDRGDASSNTTTKQASPKKAAPQIKHVQVSPSESTSAIPSPLIVQSLIERAKKAINMKQWLRAQHILEQALHIAPGNGKIFLIYGDVYLNLGILAQAEQMYRRAMALAGENSAIGHMASIKLNKLETGN